MKQRILATRGSKLALAQANAVKTALEQQGWEITLRIISTKGDRNQTDPLRKIGGQGLFIREIEAALVRGEADFAVHSGKDLPYHLSAGLQVQSVLQAADARDCLLLPKDTAISRGFVLGTSSPRRAAQWLRLHPETSVADIRGNIDTRIQKLRSGSYHGILLAKAGLDRLAPALADITVVPLSTDTFVPAACQGILAAEYRAEDTLLQDALQRITDTETQRRFALERRVFCSIQSDCATPIGVHVQSVTQEQGALQVFYQDTFLEKTFAWKDSEAVLLECREKWMGR